MSHNKILTSIHGLRLGLSASGGILHRPTTSTGVSHAAEISSAGVFNSSIMKNAPAMAKAEITRETMTVTFG